MVVFVAGTDSVHYPFPDWLEAVRGNMAHADASTLVRRGREERLFLTTFSFGHFANDWTAGSILLLTPEPLAK